MFKNLSFLTTAGVFGISLLTSACILSVTDDDDGSDEAATEDEDTTAGTDETAGTETTETTTDDDVGTDTDTTAGETTEETTEESTTGGSMCGWDANGGYYDCSFEGEDPSATFPYDCPADLVEGAPCEDSGLVGEGCCDANGDNWYCTQEGLVFYNACGG